jgi:hypothetical protein
MTDRNREPKRLFRREPSHAPAPALLDIRLPADKSAPAESKCPRCQSKLAERFGFGWCQRCGYCRYFQDRAPISDELGDYYCPEAMLAAPSRSGLLPQWLSVLVCGWIVCAVMSYLAVRNVPDDPRAHVAWCLAQASVGATMLVAAHFSAFFTIVPPGRRVRHSSLFLSPQLWWAVWRRLPETRGAVWLVGWGASVLVGAGVMYAVLERVTLAIPGLPF